MFTSVPPTMIVDRRDFELIDFLVDLFEDNEDKESCNSNSQSSKVIGQPLIYSGARLTLMASMLLVLTFSMKHSLTSEALSDLLLLVELHCLSPNVFRTTIKLFNAFFKDLRSVIEFHYYCKSRKCYTYLGTNPPEICPTCHAYLAAKKNCSYFVVVPIIQQLQALLNSKYSKQFLKQLCFS